MNRNEADFVVTLTAQGAGEIGGEETYYGQKAIEVRGRSQRMTPAELQAGVERQLARSLGPVKIISLISADAQAESRFGLKLGFRAERFGQLMQSRLLVFRPGAVLPYAGYFLPAGDRQRPIELRAQSGRHTVRVSLPEGFAIDEMPSPVRLDGPYGTYQASWETAGGQVTLEESLDIRAVTAPAEEYKPVREFFERIYSGQQSPVVLIKR